MTSGLKCVPSQVSRIPDGSPLRPRYVNAKKQLSLLFHMITVRTTHPGVPLQPHIMKAQKDKNNSPFLCLCFGFSQIILMLPFLLMTLHFSQIGLTDDLTFTANPPFQTMNGTHPRASLMFYHSSSWRTVCAKRHYPKVSV